MQFKGTHSLCLSNSTTSYPCIYILYAAYLHNQCIRPVVGLEAAAAQEVYSVWLEESQETVEAHYQEAQDLLSHPGLLHLQGLVQSFFQ